MSLKYEKPLFIPFKTEKEETVLGKCATGSGDADACQTGNSAGTACQPTGNSAGTKCQPFGNGFL